MSGGFQQARRDLCDFLGNLPLLTGWQATTETDPDKFHKLIEVGHASSIRPMSMRSGVGTFTVTFWVSEADDLDAADQLYALFSPGTFSIFTEMATTNMIAGATTGLAFLSVTAQNIGRRDEGPSGFLAGDVLVDIQVRTSQ